MVPSSRQVFLSHSHKDKSFVSRLATDLLKAKIDVWYDAWELEIGHSLTLMIQSGIENSGYLAIVLSPDAVNSEWVRREWTAAFKKELEKRSVIILPILYKVCEIPLLLGDKVYADFTDQYRYEEKLGELIRRIRGESKKPLVKTDENAYPHVVRASFQENVQLRKGNELEIYYWLGSQGSGGGRISIGRMKDLTEDIEYHHSFSMMTILPVDVTFRGKVRGNISKSGSTTEFDLEMTENEYQKYYPYREAKRSPLVQ